jgi:hypothetical protein
MLPAVLLGHPALLVDGAFLLIAARVAEVAGNPRAGWKRTVTAGGSLASHGKHFTTEYDEMGKQYDYSRCMISYLARCPVRTVHARRLRRWCRASITELAERRHAEC